MSNGQLTIPEFAAKIKAQYPEYARLDDQELTNRILAKFPVYRDKVNTRAAVEQFRPGVKPTIRSLATEGILGLAESVFPDLERPVMGTIKGLATTATAAGGALKDMLTGKGSARAQQLISGAVKGITEGPRQVYGGIQQRDPHLAAEGLGQTAGTVGQMLLGGTKPGKIATSTAIEKVGGLPIKATTKAVTKAKEYVTGLPATPAKTMVQAVKPAARAVHFEQNLARSMPELKLSELEMGKAIQTADDLAEGVKHAKKRVWGQYQRGMGPQAERGIEAASVADAIDKSVSLKTRLQSPEAAARIQETANTYRGRSFRIEELEDLLHTTNAQLEAYYAKYPAARRAAEARNPDIAHLVAEAGALRTKIYEALDAASGGKAPRELKQRYGALLELEEEVLRRRNVAERQQPLSLAEQISRARALGHLGTTTTLGLLGGGIPGGFVGALGGLGTMALDAKMSTFLKNRQTTDALIRSALERYRGLPEPIEFGPRPTAGLLPERAGAPFEAPQVPVNVPPAAPSGLPQTWEQVLEQMYGKPPQLLKGQTLIPERAGSPFVTPPPRRSLREELRVRAGKPPKS